MNKITVELKQDKGQSTYRVSKLVNTIEFRIGQKLGYKEVEDLIVKSKSLSNNITVVIKWITIHWKNLEEEKRILGVDVVAKKKKGMHLKVFASLINFQLKRSDYETRRHFKIH